MSDNEEYYGSATASETTLAQAAYALEEGRTLTAAFIISANAHSLDNSSEPQLVGLVDKILSQLKQDQPEIVHSVAQTLYKAAQDQSLLTQLLETWHKDTAQLPVLKA